MIIKRRAKVSFIGLDRIRVTTFCQQKEFDIASIVGGRLDLETLKIVTNRVGAHFGLRVLSGDGSLEEPYALVVYRMNYDVRHLQSVEPVMDAKTLREHTYEASVWDGKK